MEPDPSGFRREWRSGWSSGTVLGALAVAAVATTGAVLAWRSSASAPFFTACAAVTCAVYVVLHQKPWLRRCVSLRCATCGASLEWSDRAVGLPVEGSVLPDASSSAIVAALARADWSPFERAEPYGSIQAWVQSPALFVGLGRCARCDGPRWMTIEAHGMGSDGVLYLGTVRHATITREDEERLLAIARARGLTTYGAS